MDTKTLAGRSSRFRKPSGPAEHESYVAGVPLARVIPRMLDERVEAVLLTQPRSEAAESFRRLANQLIDTQVVIVSSAVPDEGKTTVAMNLALALAADAAGETLIIDADLRRPTVHEWLKQPPGLGLTEVLSGTVGLEHAVHSLNNSALKILPAGGATHDPLELLGSNEARSLMNTLRERYRHVVMDTPPIVPFTDADVVAKLADGVVFVARAGVTGRKLYQQAVSLIKSAPVRGVVFNDYASNLADGRADRVGYYDYGHYGRGYRR